MFSRKQTVQIIDKLTELTQHNQIFWNTTAPPPYLNGPDSRVELVYAASHLDRWIHVYKHHYKSYLDEERYFWDEQIKVALLDSFGAPLGELPRTPNVQELFSAIQFQNPKLSKFYDDLLN